jgi:hypothetical protein
MSYRDVNSAQQAIRRNLNSVSLEPENKKALEAVAIAMAAAGKPGEFVTYMQALEKTETQVDLQTVADNVNNLVNVLKAKEQPKAEDDPNKHIAPSELRQVMDRIAVLESK